MFFVLFLFFCKGYILDLFLKLCNCTYMYSIYSIYLDLVEFTTLKMVYLARKLSFIKTIYKIDSITL